jgi:glycosyltransferase involved in cell wall biosynthesis
MENDEAKARREHDLRAIIICGEDVANYVLKGEIINSYFNPAGIFTHITLIAPYAEGLAPRMAKLLFGIDSYRLLNLPSLGSKGTFLWNRTLMRIKFRRIFENGELEQTDLIRVYGLSPHTWFGLLLAQQLQKPLIISVHSAPQMETRPPQIVNVAEFVKKFVLERRLSKSIAEASAVIAVFKSIADEIYKRYGRQAQIIPNVINPLQIRKIPSDNEPFKVITVGRQIREKNSLKLLQAIRDLPETSLTIVGDGPVLSDVRKLLKEWAMEPRITIVPSCPNNELMLLMSQHSCFAVETGYLEFSKVIMEALSIGIPVLCNSELRELEELGFFHIHFADRSPDAVRLALMEIKQNLTTEFSSASRNASIFSEKYGFSMASRAYSRLYEEVLDKALN